MADANEPVSAAMRARISQQLADIEAEEDVRILLAVESGSRAWGFHSPDSDYDVRFVYTRPVAWHYRLGKTRDVVERPIDAVLDVSGWELGKALSLALGSNAVIAEWLQSPIVYRADVASVARLTAFAQRALDRKSVTWHYMSLMRRQQSRLAGPQGGLRIKRYFYILRPTLALRWMRLNGGGMPPMDMATLIAGAALSPQVLAALETLTQAKMAARENAEMPCAAPALESLVAEETAHAEAWLKDAETRYDPGLKQAADLLHLELSQQI